MTNENILFIDGVSAWSAYGLGVLKGGHVGIVQWPSLKTPDYIDWPEEHGIEPDLLNPCLDTKKSIRLDLFCKNAPACVDSLMAVLHGSAYHNFYFKEIGVAVPLRFVEVVNRKRVDSLETFTVNMACDESYLTQMQPNLGEAVYLTFNGDRLVFNEKLLLFHVFDEGHESHNTFSVPALGLLIDGVDISRYWAMPLEGTREAITTAAPLKDNLIISSKQMPGQHYPDTVAVKGFRQVDIPILMRAVHPPQFWENYIAFLTMLVQPGHRTLTFGGKNYKFYYSSQSVRDFIKLPGNEIWCQFDLSVIFFEGD